jgi:hypothetical protein
MRTIETTAAVTGDHRLTVDVQVPAEVLPGNHRVILVLDETPLPARRASVFDFPVIDVGPWPEGLSLRREDMYGDDGR